ncbi:hypothetical protein AVEN_218866-1 [Araneus ventricosus]|uniref:Uncharacterized protein n=1 Tax=Araneus ventricosus TaxID=182803 RepID=A0A4Y1ZWX4_ARAVE|nr:hypothetical protein AVEN_218866-1 [Araneus ventricosus]
MADLLWNRVSNPGVFRPPKIQDLLGHWAPLYQQIGPFSPAKDTLITRYETEQRNIGFIQGKSQILDQTLPSSMKMRSGLIPKRYHFFCYAIDESRGFHHVAERWIPLFKERVCDFNDHGFDRKQRSLRRKAEVIHNLAGEQMQPAVEKSRDSLHLHLSAIDAFLSQPLTILKALIRIKRY